MKNKNLQSTFRRYYIKTFSWEYWPMWLVYLPASFYFVYLSIKARSFFFFSASNPSIETGGMFFESKWDIFKLIPKEYYPTTILAEKEDDINMLLYKMEKAGLDFPVIAKPDRGERGWCVKKINTKDELSSYRASIHISFLVQAYVNLPLEFSIFYYRNPRSENGTVTSVTLKKLLIVTGNGSSTIDELIQRNDRAFLQYQKLRQDKIINLNHIPAAGEEIVLVPYGNHVLGAMFVNYNHIIDEDLINTIDRISKGINGFYFGRYDLRCTSIEDLKAGKNISVLELNGAGAEPSHIYDPGFSFLKAQAVIAKHYTMMYHAAMENRKRGISFMTFKEYSSTRKLEKAYKEIVNNALVKNQPNTTARPPGSNKKTLSSFFIRSLHTR